MVLLAVGGAAYGAVKLSQKDADRIEEHTGGSVEEMSEEELVAAMKELGIQSIELTDEDKTALAAESGAESGAEPAAEPQEDYLNELEHLSALRDQGVITEEDFEAKKKQLLGLWPRLSQTPGTRTNLFARVRKSRGGRERGAGSHVGHWLAPHIRH